MNKRTRTSRRNFLVGGGAASALALTLAWHRNHRDKGKRVFPMNEKKEKIRDVTRVVRAQSASDGAGVRLERVIATRELPDVDPFLLLDAFKSDSADDYIGGFPMHPHRGFETVTYMIAGEMHHRDSMGSSGTIGPGDVQWMTAGRGIVHEEMPAQKQGLMFGFQLWVNLPKAQKMTAPRYQNISSTDIPAINRSDGSVVRVIAGEVDDAVGPVAGIPTKPLYLDVSIPHGGRFHHWVRAENTTAAFVFEGSGEFGEKKDARGKEVKSKELALFGKGDMVTVHAAKEPCRFLLIAGKPLNEPIARGGPFVMNTEEELRQAYIDYQNGVLGT